MRLLTTNGRIRAANILKIHKFVTATSARVTSNSVHFSNNFFSTQFFGIKFNGDLGCSLLRCQVQLAMEIYLWWSLLSWLFSTWKNRSSTKRLRASSVLRQNIDLSPLLIQSYISSTTYSFIICLCRVPGGF